mmetsp:Transcript_3484/g.7189  ORF Transcript_3484/g.7189 Transcript_3484/m.7189 type:complete len:229 (+) Transcript_3484:217-903(+)
MSGTVRAGDESSTLLLLVVLVLDDRRRRLLLLTFSFRDCRCSHWSKASSFKVIATVIRPGAISASTMCFSRGWILFSREYPSRAGKRKRALESSSWPNICLRYSTFGVRFFSIDKAKSVGKPAIKIWTIARASRSSVSTRSDSVAAATSLLLSTTNDVPGATAWSKKSTVCTIFSCPRETIWGHWYRMRRMAFASRDNSNLKYPILLLIWIRLYVINRGYFWMMRENS